MRLLVATQNQGKVAEYRRRLKDLEVELLEPTFDVAFPAPEETGASFEDNARLKAEAYMKHFGMPAISDDSGLEIDVLGGFPGVRSARHAGPGASWDDLIEAVLRRLRPHRQPWKARFVCVAAVAAPGRATVLTRAELRGRIVDQPRGDCGFGYDPIFYVRSLRRTVGELSPQEKDSISHRAMALRALADRGALDLAEGPA